MNYKKILKNQDLQFKILNLLSWIPDKTMVKIQYRIKLGRKLDLKNPKRFTEKLQWYKLYYRKPIMHQCVDKYEVRKYVESKGLKSILNELYGVYDNPEDIDFEKLPKKFVIKTTSGTGGQNVLLCNNKDKLDIKETVDKLKHWLKLNPKKSFGREWAYEGTKNKIIIEKLLEGNDDNLSGVNDYKFFCYNGKAKYIVLDGDRFVEHKRNFYDRDWNYIDIQTDCGQLGDVIKKPKGLNEMLKVAEQLSTEFPYVRVDLYCIKNKVYFGEMTFYPWTGYVHYYPDEFDFELGKDFVTNKASIERNSKTVKKDRK